MLNDIIGNRMRECRLDKKLTQENLADRLNLSHQLISKAVCQIIIWPVIILTM